MTFMAFTTFTTGSIVAALLGASLPASVGQELAKARTASGSSIAGDANGAELIGGDLAEAASLGDVSLVTTSIEAASTEEDSTRGDATRERPAVDGDATLPRAPDFPHRVVLKFRDDLGMRAVGGTLIGREARAIRIDPRLRLAPLIKLPSATLEFLEARAEAASGRAQPDLASMMELTGPPELLASATRALHASDLVEWVEYEMLTPPPPVMGGCADAAPTTSNYVALQGYRGANPGLGVNAFWALGNSRGAGVRIADCEYWYDGDHEDLCGIVPEPGQTPHPDVLSLGWNHHGTAVLGEVAGIDNAYGVRGISPSASVLFFPEWTVEQGPRRATAIAQAIAAVDAGDVVMLEMQTTLSGSGSNYGPAELSLSVWNLVRNATDAGIIVVAAAGNGAQDLDGAGYAAYRARGDSGAIIVGAGTASVQHARLSFSTFGARVNVQGWGNSVFTTGYGDYSQVGGDVHQAYTAGFGGTSAATPFIAASCAALQGFAQANVGRRLTPGEMRQVLMTTGWPQQGGGGAIGSFPNLPAAAEAILALVPTPDLNGDGMVDALDLAALLAQWGPCAGCSGDFDHDGVVGGFDLAALLGAWGSVDG